MGTCQVTPVGRKHSGRRKQESLGVISSVSRGGEDEILRPTTTSLGPYIAAWVC